MISLSLNGGDVDWMSDHSVDKELAGWSHSKGFSLWLNVQVETSDVWSSSGVRVVTVPV